MKPDSFCGPKRSLRSANRRGRAPPSPASRLAHPEMGSSLVLTREARRLAALEFDGERARARAERALDGMGKTTKEANRAVRLSNAKGRSRYGPLTAVDGGAPTLTRQVGKQLDPRWRSSIERHAPNLGLLSDASSAQGFSVTGSCAAVSALATAAARPRRPTPRSRRGGGARAWRQQRTLPPHAFYADECGVYLP